MRADQEVWVIQRVDTGAVVCIDPSFKMMLLTNDLSEELPYRDTLNQTKAKLRVPFKKNGLDYEVFRVKMQEPGVFEEAAVEEEVA